MATKEYYLVDGLLLSGVNISENTEPDKKTAIDLAKLLIQGDASKAATLRSVKPDGKGAYDVFVVQIAQAKPFTYEKGFSTVFYG
jgi:hypothetical protein